MCVHMMCVKKTTLKTKNCRPLPHHHRTRLHLCKDLLTGSGPQENNFFYFSSLFVKECGERVIKFKL